MVLHRIMRLIAQLLMRLKRLGQLLLEWFFTSHQTERIVGSQLERHYAIPVELDAVSGKEADARCLAMKEVRARAAQRWLAVRGKDEANGLAAFNDSNDRLLEDARVKAHQNLVSLQRNQQNCVC